jgi:hypothetical protein
MLFQHYFLQPDRRFYSASGFCFRYVCRSERFERFLGRSHDYHVGNCFASFWYAV